MRNRKPFVISRRGATAVEAALVIPAFLMFTVGTCIMGLGVFRYQQVGTLAREGARYASVHGSQYATDTGNTAASSTDVYNNAIKPLAAGLNASKLTYSVQWGTDTSGTWVWTSWDSSGKAPTSVNPNSSPVGLSMYNAVQVTVSYQWTPELYVAGPINLTSTSVIPMSY
jgi:Flp pilus assembly protein TadG